MINWEIVYNAISTAEQAVKAAGRNCEFKYQILLLEKKLKSILEFDCKTLESIPEILVIEFQDATIDLLRVVGSERRVVSACASIEVIADRITHLCDSQLVAS